MQFVALFTPSPHTLFLWSSLFYLYCFSAAKESEYFSFFQGKQYRRRGILLCILLEFIPQSLPIVSFALYSYAFLSTLPLLIYFTCLHHFTLIVLVKSAIYCLNLIYFCCLFSTKTKRKSGSQRGNGMSATADL
uniref:Uncharacterized protein n=1 Tax=Palpitomonas bilix TaxID=652834 RepID=A0A7S3G7Q9_9EUKA|mmetsp:Transcript_36811/g.95310  ORF Transcript_36811/g.95310 Transcript_36811/m.95310 type:complete len:134 (+) Transcript_36811:704-1105(+)